MLKNLKIFVLICICFTIQIQAQTLEYKKYNWEAEPVLHTLSKEEKESNYTYLKDKTILDFVYESTGELVMYETKHVIIRLNDDKGIEEMNKIYIPTYSVLEEINLKARTITSTGKVINLGKDAFKKVEDYEESGPFTIFAMEGIDVGSEIEYIYTNKKNFRLNNSIYVQTDKIKKGISIDIYSPENLIYEGKGYNGFPNFTVDTIIKKKNHIYASLEKIDALLDEKYSAGKANRMRYDYQVTYNTANSRSRLYTWEQIGNNIYNNIYTFSKTETKSIEKLISKLELAKLNSEEKKIRSVEQYIKSSINYKDLDESIDVDKMLNLKYGNKTSFLKLYILLAKELNIPCEVVATCDRTERKFDPAFQSQNSIQEFMIYFPGIGKYLSPTNYFSRIGYPTLSLVGHKGLFIKETEIGDIKTGLSKVKNIELSDDIKSYNNITASVTFSSDNLLPTIKLYHEFMGYSASSIQPAILYADDEKQKEFQDEMSKIMGASTVVKSSSMKGIKNEDVLVNPLIIESVIETPHLIENAGNKYLFKIGEMIGPQEQLYQEKERQTEIDILFLHSYTRTFDIKIPEGYKVKNVEALNIDKRYIDDGKELATFVSSYKLEGNILKVNIFEDYKSLIYPKSNFEQYRSVINASADFNKIIIIFEKL